MGRAIRTPPRKPRPPKAPRKGPGGPRTKRTKQTADLICEMIEKGTPRTVAADLAGIGTTTLYDWMATDAEFLNRIHNAEHALHRKAAATVVDALDPEQEMGHRLIAAKYLLSNRFANLWSTRTEVHQTGTVEHTGKVEVTVRPLIDPETLSTMTPEQIEAAIRAVKG